MCVLLFCSGFFSGSETAFFNLSRRESLTLRDSSKKLARLVFLILKTPKRLLTTLLFGNMLINVSYFAISSTVSIRISASSGKLAGISFGVSAFILLVIFGEMLPKSIAYSRSRFFAVVAALPCYILQLILRPIIFVLNLLVIEPIIRLFIPATNNKQEIDIAHLKQLMKLSQRRGSITTDQNELISEVLELSFLKLRHLMKPRVDMVFGSIDSSLKDAVAIMRENSIKKLPIYSGDIDNIQGVLMLRDALLEPEETIEKLLKEPFFVPEQKSVESLLDFFRRKELDFALVVDEYGGISGLLTMKDIIAELLGARPSEIENAVQQIAPKEYLLSGDLAFHDWASSLGLQIDNKSSSTLGGFVISLMGKIPVSGDCATYGNMKFTIEKMDRYRIAKLRLTASISQTSGESQC